MLLGVCGIAGSTDDPRGVAVRAMCELLRHRGPDAGAVFIDAGFAAHPIFAFTTDAFADSLATAGRLLSGSCSKTAAGLTASS